jgi:hypothetical protein
MMGECQNVQTYAAAQVFYWTGMNGMTYVLDIFIADTSLLKNRLIWIAITGSPYVCNTFAGPELGQRFLISSSWRWGYRAFAIITPFICMPFWAIFFLMSRRAEDVGVIRRQKSKRTITQSFVYWCVEFDGECTPCSVLFSAHSNSCPSRWSTPHLWWLFTLPATVQSRDLSEAGLGFADDNLYDNCRPSSKRRLRIVGAFLGSKDVLPLSPHEGPLDRGGMLPWLQLLDCFLISVLAPQKREK